MQVATLIDLEYISVNFLETAIVYCAEVKEEFSDFNPGHILLQSEAHEARGFLQKTMRQE